MAVVLEGQSDEDDMTETDGGEDTVSGGDGSDTMDGGDGSDTVPAFNGQVPDEDASFDGTPGDDTISARDAGGTIAGREGDDFINGSDTDDRLLGGQGNDTFEAGDGDDTVLGGRGDDRLILGEGDDNTWTNDDDYAQGRGDDLIAGRSGDDVVIDIYGSNLLRGGLGDDFISALDGMASDGTVIDADENGTPDTITAGFGNDTIHVDDGDEVSDEGGADQITVHTDVREDPDAVDISDFDPAQDALVLMITDTAADPDLILFTHDAEAGGISVTYQSQQIAFLRGLGAADVDAASEASTLIYTAA